MKLVSAIVLCGALASVGCSTYDSDKSGTTLIPNKTLNISDSLRIPAEGLVAGALLYIIIDPLAPNWKIEQSQLDLNHYRLALTKKRFTTGGDGEAIQVFYRWAADLARERGAKDYRIVEYTEGVESTVPVAQRVARGVIELTL